MTGDAGGWLITDRLFGVAERDAGRELVVDTAPVWHLGGLFTGSTSWRKITPMKKTYYYDKRFICKDCCSIFSSILPKRAS